MKNKRWTTNEENKLKLIYREPKDVICSEFEGRTWRSITTKINRLGLKRRRWSKGEEKLLKEIYPHTDWDELTKVLPRHSEVAIRAKANREGLQREMHQNKPGASKIIPSKGNESGIKRRNKFRVNIDKRKLYEKYFIEGLNVRDCEEYFNCSNQVILTRLRKWFPDEYNEHLKKLRFKYTLDDIKTLVEADQYELIRYEGNREVVQTKGYITVSCPNPNHEQYSVLIYSFISGGRCRKCYFENNKGANNPAYNSNLTEEDRENNRFVEGYKKWRSSVYERDNYKCQNCQDETGGNLVAHHLNGYDWYLEGRVDVDNGITLCDKCHRAFHKKYGYGNNTKEQFKDWNEI